MCPLECWAQCSLFFKKMKNKKFARFYYHRYFVKNINKISSAPSSSPTEVMLKQAFSEMDRDNDGRVTEDEFVSATLGHEKVATLLTMKIVNCLVQPWKIYNSKRKSTTYLCQNNLKEKPHLLMKVDWVNTTYLNLSNFEVLLHVFSQSGSVW